MLKGYLSRGYLSQGAYVLGGKCPGGKCPGGKCPGGKCPGVICPWGKCPGVHVRGLYVLGVSVRGYMFGGLCPSGEPVPTQQCIWKCAPRSADCNAPNLYEIICKFMSNVFIIIRFISTERSDIILFYIMYYMLCIHT